MEKKLLNDLFDELFPIMRSISGPGIEESLNIFKKHMPSLEIHKTPSNSKVFDWEVPMEWHFKRAQLFGPDGEVICDTNDLNLHVLNYSIPIDKKLSLQELNKHLYSLPDLPDAVPYVTSYYKKNWGFSISHNKRKLLKEGLYHAKIDCKFVKGGVPYAECLLKGESEKEILLSSYLCHPSLANNELSGPLVLLGLYKRISSWKKRRYSYRFLLNPETIGSLCFLNKNRNTIKDKIITVLVLTCLGGPSKKLNYKLSRNIDSVMNKVISSQKDNFSIPINEIPFTATGGSDERQFCSPGFNLPIGQISRTTYANYEGYHNSLDNKEFLIIDNLIESIDVIEQILKYTEVCGNPVNQSPFGEVQLGKRGLYPNINSSQTGSSSSDVINDGRVSLNRRLTMLNMSDGKNSLIDIARECKCSVDDLLPTLEFLESKNLIKYNTKIKSL